MTGLDSIREELEKRGYSKAQLYSKVLPAVLDIVSNSGNKYTDMWKSEGDASNRLKDIQSEIRGNEETLKRQKALMEKWQTEIEIAKEQREHCEDYIDEFNKSLQECETKEGRDAMRIAQMYINSIDTQTKYDNTAFIIGLASILSRGGMNAIEALSKINKKLPSVNQYVEMFPEWFVRTEKWGND